MKYFGSALSISNISPKNAHSWKIDLTKGSIFSTIISLVGVPHTGSRIRNRVVLRILKSKPNIKSIIDIGGGIGLTGFYLNQFGYEYLGIDKSSYKIRIANRLLNESKYKKIDFLLGDIFKKLPVKNKFDCALSMEVLEHVKQPAEMIDAMSKLVKPKGSIILSFPSVHHVNGISQEYFGHVRVGYTPDDIKKLINGSRLKIESVMPIGNTLLCKIGFYIDYFLIKYIPLVSGVYFWIFYPVVVFDEMYFNSSQPVGYVIVLKNE